MMSSHPDDDFKLVETLRNKNDFNIRYYHSFCMSLFLAERNFQTVASLIVDHSYTVMSLRRESLAIY